MSRRITTHMRNQWAGFIALFLVLTGGVAYAANTIGSADIIDGQVKTADIASDAVTTYKLGNGAVHNNNVGASAITGDKVKESSLSGSDVVNNSLKGADIDESSLSLGAPNVITRSTYIPSSSGTVSCNPGEVAIGGGVGVDSASGMYVARSEPSPNSGVPTGWTGVVAYRVDGTPASGTVYVLCAS